MAQGEEQTPLVAGVKDMALKQLDLWGERRRYLEKLVEDLEKLVEEFNAAAAAADAVAEACATMPLVQRRPTS